MIKAIRIHENGGPEVLKWEDVELPPPAAGEARLQHTAIALNFSDVNVRRGGFYIAQPLQFPVILGNEAAGIVESVGPDVNEVRPGDRVAYVGTGGPFYENTGAYAEARNLRASCLIKLPRSISDRQAAALMLKGLTASMIIMTGLVLIAAVATAPGTAKHPTQNPGHEFGPRQPPSCQTFRLTASERFHNLTSAQESINAASFN